MKITLHPTTKLFLVTTFCFNTLELQILSVIPAGSTVAEKSFSKYTNGSIRGFNLYNCAWSHNSYFKNRYMHCLYGHPPFVGWWDLHFLLTVNLYIFIHWDYDSHCVKSVQIRSFFWSVFSCIRIEHRKVRTRKNSVFGHFSSNEWYLSGFLQNLNQTTSSLSCRAFTCSKLEIETPEQDVKYVQSQQ